jgi:hypothetical protein
MLKLLCVSILVFITSGCAGTMSWVAWRGYDAPIEPPPSPGSYKPVAGNCFSIGVQNLNAKQETAILEAAGKVCAVLTSTAFKERVVSQQWITSCDKAESDDEDWIKGPQIYRILSSNIPNFSVHPKKPWMAIAQADLANKRMAIDPDRINEWYSDNQKGNLINTIAHEITHLTTHFFRDRGHGTPKCPDAKLVSYGMGNLVEELAEF